MDERRSNATTRSTINPNGVILVALSTNDKICSCNTSPSSGTKFLKTNSSTYSFNFSKKGEIESNEKITASNGTIESRVTYERYPE